MLEKMKEIAFYVNDIDKGWYSLKPEFSRIFENKSIDILIKEFEESLDDIPSGKLPNYCLIFYLALITLYETEDIKEIIKSVKDKKSYMLMKIGLRIFLSGKSDNLKYESDLLDDNNLKNKYIYIKKITSSVTSVERKLRGYIELLILIYEEDKACFWKLLESDKQNLIVLYFLLNEALLFDYKELVPIINSNDEVRVNSALYYLMERFNYLVSKIRIEKNEKNTIELNNEISEINKIFKKFPLHRRVHLIINYIFEEETCPYFFIEELGRADIKSILFELKEQDTTNLFQMIKIKSVLEIVREPEIQVFFGEKLVIWVKYHFNLGIWNQLREDILGIIEIIDSETKTKIRSELRKIKEELFTSSFDREVRFKLYLENIRKSQIIEDILSF